MEVGEQGLAKKHLKGLNPNNDLLLFDRGYPSIGFALELDSKGKHIGKIKSPLGDLSI
jgi:hypothetical protein